MMNCSLSTRRIEAGATFCNGGYEKRRGNILINPIDKPVWPPLACSEVRVRKSGIKWIRIACTQARDRFSA